MIFEKKAEFVASFDWWAIIEQDKGVWDKIFEFIES